MEPRRLPGLVAALACLCVGVGLSACRHRGRDASTDGSPGASAPVPDDVAMAEVVTARPAPWCFTPRPLVDLRAIDPHGHVWSIAHGHLADETSGVVTPLADEVPCPVPGAWAFEFLADGSAYALVDSRFYLRPEAGAPLGVTPMCSDVRGAPWSARSDGGWAFVVRTWPASGPGLMLTNNRTGASGWYAVTALDSTLSAAVLEPDRSMVMLANGGHLMFVDQTRHVAGEVLASQGALFTGLGRSAAGVVAFRDDGPTGRVIVSSGATVQQAFTASRGQRPTGAPTRAVFRADVARVLAVTDTGVELSTDHGRHYTRVLDTPVPLERPVFGWIEGLHPALAVRSGVVTDHCLEPAVR